VFVSDAPQQSCLLGARLSAGRGVFAVGLGAEHLHPNQPKRALPGTWSRPFWIAVALLACLPLSTVYAQHASDDPLATANDAFGLTLGLESIGLYGPGLVRGFNPQTFNALVARPQALMMLRKITQQRCSPWVAVTGSNSGVHRQRCACRSRMRPISISGITADPEELTMNGTTSRRCSRLLARSRPPPIRGHTPSAPRYGLPCVGCLKQMTNAVF
jgi:hypothetical protein